MTKKPPKDRFQSLTKREKEVLQLVCQHNSYQKIADELFIGKTTVKTHMHNIYIKLELEDLARDDRIMQIHNVYCPLFLEVEEPKKRSKRAHIGSGKPKPTLPSEGKQTENQPKNAQIIPNEAEPEPEPITTEEEAVIDGDEMALITYKPITITAGGKKNVDKPKKKHGCFKYIFGFILGVAFMIGLWQGWLCIKDNSTVQSIIALINPDFIPQSEIEDKESPNTQPVAEPTSLPIEQGETEPQTTAAQIQTVDYGDVTELNDWYKEDDVWLRMFDYQVVNDMIEFRFEIWNKSGQDLYFSWSPEGNFSMVDNQGNRYEVWNSHSYDEQIGSEERLELNNMGPQTLEYHNEPMFAPDVTDLYITVEYLSRIDKAVFHLPVGK
jgi:hypothetical protein